MNINIVQVLFQIFNFSILVLVMKKYLYKPILEILELRSKKIEAGLEAAEKSIEEQEKLEKKKKKVLVEAEKSAAQVIEAARQRAKKIEKDLSLQADTVIEKKLKKSELINQARVKDLELELQKRFSESVVNTSESLLKDSLDPKLQKAIINSHLAKLKKIKFA